MFNLLLSRQIRINHKYMTTWTNFGRGWTFSRGRGGKLRMLWKSCSGVSLCRRHDLTIILISCLRLQKPIPSMREYKLELSQVQMWILEPFQLGIEILNTARVETSFRKITIILTWLRIWPRNNLLWTCPVWLSWSLSINRLQHHCRRSLQVRGNLDDFSMKWG